jgi:hypothetical protein
LSDDTLKELSKEDLGGGITVRRVLPVGGIWGKRLPKPYIGSPHPFFIVTLLWEDRGWSTGGGISDFEEPGGIVEARIFPPRPADGPHGEGWLVTDCPGLAGQQGTFSSYADALAAVLADLRTLDGQRRLGGSDKPWGDTL